MCACGTLVELLKFAVEILNTVARPHFRLPMVCVCAVCIVVLYLPGFSATATTDVWHECTFRNLDVLHVT